MFNSPMIGREYDVTFLILSLHLGFICENRAHLIVDRVPNLLS
jgi:hypothetical protein